MEDKVVVVTGASSGIGKSLALVFARNGYRVVISARTEDRLLPVRNQIEQLGGSVIAVTADVAKEADCKKLIDETIRVFGRVDVLINNAGISMRALFEHTELSVIRQVMDINFWGTVYCTKFALPHLLKTKGSVVGISSIAGKKGLPGRTGYSASKFAMEGFLETLRTENLKTGLHVLVACPGFTASNIRNTALAADGSAQGESPRDENKMMQPDDVAEKIMKAVKSRKRDLILSGQGKLTVILNKFFPGMMDKMVFNHMAKEPDSPLK
ncbi:MAG TPA: SDR family oxidoreductase [Bacteroidia bacterium]|nr:SDR family oxidoreductase [Bacteroidia bacterium]